MNRDQYWQYENFCPAPWTEIYVASDGRVDNCCISASNLGNIGTETAEDIIAGQLSQLVRAAMMRNEYVPGCKECLKSPAKTPLRDSYKEWFEHIDTTHFSDTNNFRLGFLDVRWRNTCNSACVYCGPKDSSLWASEMGVAQASDQARLKNMKHLIESRAHEIEYLYLAGGEPLLIKENEWLLKTVLSINPDCEIRVNTNLTAIDNQIFDTLCQFPMVHWIISGESVGPQYEYVRYGSNWKQFIANVQTLKDKAPNHIRNFHMVYCALTAHTIFDYMDYLKTNGIFSDRTDCFNVYYYCGGIGGPLDARNLPMSLQQQNYQMLDRLLTTLDHTNARQKNFALALATVKSILDSPYQDRQCQSLVDFLQMTDQRRKLDSRLVFPELYREPIA